jgi:predicted 3-demethylubiquinone-9 3-methyltransferase (glyoxalase superfamily)
MPSIANTVPSVTPFLWFDGQAEEAMRHYLATFPGAREIGVSRAGPQVMSVEFEIAGQRFIGLNGGPMYRFNEAVSFLVACDTQDEIDHYWDALTAGGEPGQCGWLKDRFGLSWQVVPRQLPSWLSGGGDPARATRVLDVMLASRKLEIAAFERAYAGDVASVES